MLWLHKLMIHCVVNESPGGKSGIGGQHDMQPATVIVRTYENDVNGDPITDTER